MRSFFQITTLLICVSMLSGCEHVFAQDSGDGGENKVKDAKSVSERRKGVKAVSKSLKKKSKKTLSDLNDAVKQYTNKNNQTPNKQNKMDDKSKTDSKEASGQKDAIDDGDKAKKAKAKKKDDKTKGAGDSKRKKLSKVEAVNPKKEKLVKRRYRWIRRLHGWARVPVKQNKRASTCIVRPSPNVQPKIVKKNRPRVE